MKKKCTLFLAFITMMVASQAQTLLSESFESFEIPAGWIRIDNDGDLYNWDPMNAFTGYNGGSCIISASYNGGALTPDNWLITSPVNLTSNAVLTFYVAGSDPEYYQENYSVYISTTGNNISDFTTLLTTGVTTNNFVQQSVDLSAYTGQTVYIAFRHHNCTDQYCLRLDEVVVLAETTSPTIEALPQSVDFGEVSFPGCHHSQISVNGYMLTGDITATTAAPFSISSDGTDYGTSATLNSAGGKIYIRYNPTTAGQTNGTVTLSSPGAGNTTVNVSATAKECHNTPLPYVFDFNNNEKAKCWSTVDVNHDAAAGGYGEIEISTEAGFAVYGFSSENDADDWLISPSFTLGSGAAATFGYSATANMTGYVAPEKYEVYIIPDGQTYENATLVIPVQEIDNTEWLTQTVDLSAFAGQTLQVAIRVVSDVNSFVFGVNHFTLRNNVVGIEERDTHTNIYPNPASTQMHVYASSPMSSISIYSISGQLIQTIDANGEQTDINVTDLSNGLYLMKINTENGVVTRKFNVVR